MLLSFEDGAALTLNHRHRSVVVVLLAAAGRLLLPGGVGLTAMQLVIHLQFGANDLLRLSLILQRMPRLWMVLVLQSEHCLINDLVLGEGHLGVRQVHFNTAAGTGILELGHVDQVVIVLGSAHLLYRIRGHLNLVPILLDHLQVLPLGVG